ncbi:hypothetical protein K502DRAFT_351943 [Neoconidiobolus thromboides FSU 785]|nr:hypothetical protein K502DRAFT_351943 [Neoconidiobolus thromboides FSU 785]
MNIKELNYNASEEEKYKIEININELNNELNCIQNKIIDLVQLNTDNLYQPIESLLNVSKKIELIQQQFFYLMENINSIKLKTTSSSIILEKKIQLLQRFTLLSQILRDILRKNQLIMGLFHLTLDNEETCIYINKIEDKINFNNSKLTMILPLISYLNYRKKNNYLLSFNHILSGLNWKDNLLLSKGLNNIENLNLIFQLKKELINKNQFNFLLNYINQLIQSYENNKNDKNNNQATLFYWKQWSNRLTNI